MRRVLPQLWAGRWGQFRGDRWARLSVATSSGSTKGSRRPRTSAAGGLLAVPSPALQYPHLAHLASAARPASTGLRGPHQGQFATGRGRRRDVELDRLKWLRQKPVDLLTVTGCQPDLPSLLAAVHHPYPIGGGWVQAIVLRTEGSFVVRLGIMPPRPRD